MCAAAVALGTSACSPIPGFGCNDDAQCRRGDAQGLCEPIGFCAYPDTDCPSGMRFSGYAGSPYANECTTPEPDSTSTGTGDGGSESGGSSTGLPLPVCGNGVVEDGEACDDADPASAECNRCCQRSGVRLEELYPASRMGSNDGYDIVVLDSGDMVVAGAHVVVDQGVDALVIRFSPSGELIWSRSFHGEPHGDADPPNLPDHARAVTLSPAGDRLLVAGFLTPDTAPATMEDPKVTPRAMMWLAELDVETGDSIWEHLDGDAPPSIDQAWDATYDPEGGIVMAGREGPSPQSFAVRRYTVTPNRDVDMGLDYTVTTDWTRAISGEGGGSFAYAVLVDGGEVFAAGSVYQVDESHRRLQAFLLADGEEPELPCLDRGEATSLANDDRIYDLALAPDGHIAAAGYQFKFSDKGRDAWVGWYSPDGCDLVWQRTKGGLTGQHDEAHGVAVDDDGNLFAAGFMHNNDSSQDVWVAKFRPMHEMLWETTHDGPASGNDQAWGVALEAETCEVLVAGHVRSQQGRSDIWVGRFTQ